MSRYEWKDEDGYPTDHALEVIAKWNTHNREEIDKVLEFAASLWWHPELVTFPSEDPDGNRWEFVTGGWSGNESIIGAMERNEALYMLAWESSHRAGRHTFLPRLVKGV